MYANAKKEVANPQKRSSNKKHTQFYKSAFSKQSKSCDANNNNNNDDDDKTDGKMEWHFILWFPCQSLLLLFPVLFCPVGSHEKECTCKGSNNTTKMLFKNTRRSQRMPKASTSCNKINIKEGKRERQRVREEDKTTWFWVISVIYNFFTVIRRTFLAISFLDVGLQSAVKSKD